MTKAGSAGRFESDGDAGDDVRRRAGPGRLHDLLHGTIATARVVLRDPDENEGGGDADDAADQVLDLPYGSIQKVARIKANDGESRR